METQGGQLGLHGTDGGFQRGIFARDKAFCVHVGILPGRGGIK
jgi:hypothetical protein